MDGVATAEDPPLRVGRQLCFRVDLRSAPSTNNHNTTQEETLAPRTAPHPVQHTYTMHCATARCVSAVSLKHARHAHVQVTRETHHTRCTQAAFLKSSTSPTVLPGAPLRRLVCGRQLCFRVDLRSAPSTNRHTGHKRSA